ncbi:ExeA family protein [Thalassotalea sp. PLHSN55]|uniref:ExeA family protein n=1 Tax=Thalassotalea sp. PLHSN55 TaxID=3435888 RepID=UPI003F84D2DD
MYTDFFGLSEIPFSIAPNPHYLFMSDRHKEALAHLTYGLGTTGGFVLLTGEVGTGKTTISRCLLEQVPENTQVAFILNPTLSSQELLATICDELKIRYRKTGATLKTLTDKIQDKLLKNHHDGINTLLIIDEAQHLRAEVLEQLRLLTNLETHTQKLLQVILIGQPELQQLLQRQDLRQLAQRITARYHLMPLNKNEVRQYIEHRLQVAGGNPNLFSAKAIATIHQLSKGIPRLINLLCDRALLGAYGGNKQQVDKALVLGASKEALGVEYQLTPWWKSVPVIALALITFISAMAFIGYSAGKASYGQSTEAEQAVANEVINEQSSAEVIISKQLVEQSRSLGQSVNHLLTLWRIEIDEPIEQPCKLAGFYQLNCYWHKGNLSSLVKLGYPAVFKFFDQQGSAFYGTLTQSTASVFTFQFAEQEREVDKLWLEQHWQGGALVFWQAPKDEQQAFVNQIDEQSSVTNIQWLEQRLSLKQQRPSRTVDSYDALLVNQINQFQRQHGLPSTKMATTKTLMLLANDVSQGLPIYSHE